MTSFKERAALRMAGRGGSEKANTRQEVNNKGPHLSQAVFGLNAWQAVLEAVADQRDQLAARIARADYDIEKFLADRDLDADVEIFDRLTLALAEFLQARRVQ